MATKTTNKRGRKTARGAGSEFDAAAGYAGLGCCLITAERRRQVEQEGWSVEHDNGHDKGQLAMAGAAYAHHATYTGPGYLWPWGREWWKPGVGRTLDTRIRALAKAGALIAAEIDRLERLRIGNGAQHPNVAICREEGCS